VRGKLQRNRERITVRGLNRNHRYTQTVWPVPAPATMHQCGIPLPGHSSARTSTATRTRARRHPGVREGTKAEKESGSVVCRTEESDRATSSTPAAIEVRTRAVLLGRGRTEHQALGSLPRPTDRTTGSHCLERKRITPPTFTKSKTSPQSQSFSTPTPDFIN